MKVYCSCSHIVKVVNSIFKAERWVKEGEPDHNNRKYDMNYRDFEAMEVE